MTKLPHPRRLAVFACVAALGPASPLPATAAPPELPVAQVLRTGLGRVVTQAGEGVSLSSSVTAASGRHATRFSMTYGRQTGASWGFAFDDALTRVESLQYSASSGWVAFEPDAAGVTAVPARAAIGASGLIGCGKALSLSAPSGPRTARPLADYCLQWSVHPGTDTANAWVCLSRTLRAVTDAAPGLDARHQSCYLAGTDGAVSDVQVWPMSLWRTVPGDAAVARRD